MARTESMMNDPYPILNAGIKSDYKPILLGSEYQDIDINTS